MEIWQSFYLHFGTHDVGDEMRLAAIPCLKSCAANFNRACFHRKNGNFLIHRADVVVIYEDALFRN